MEVGKTASAASHDSHKAQYHFTQADQVEQLVIGRPKSG